MAIRGPVLVAAVCCVLSAAAGLVAAADCVEGSFQCRDGACIPAAHHCDGYDHCGDDFDEDPEQCQGTDSHFTCKNGNLIAASAHCNGYDNCKDGSDEDPAECEVNTLFMMVDETVTARLQHNVSRGWIYFTLCDDSACSSIDLYGTTANGSLKYKPWTTCSKLGAYGCHWNSWNRPPGFIPYPTGEHVFKVQRRSLELAVWPDGKPELAVTVPVKEGYDRLRIRYFTWRRDLPRVNYTGGTMRQPASQSVDDRVGPGVCGRAVHFGPLVSGVQALPGYFPWHGALYMEDKDGSIKYSCGASLLTKNALLTAAHCVVARHAKYFVALGIVYSDWHKNVTGVHRSKVSRVSVHPDYYGAQGKYAADVALLFMEEGATLSHNIAPVCLVRGEEQEQQAVVRPDDVLTIAGWGNGKTALDTLHFVELPFLPRRQCLAAITKSVAFALSYVTNDKFCTVRDRGVLLQGDSGGGAVVRRDGTWYLVGIVSNGIDSNRIVAYINVTFGDYASWIENEIRDDDDEGEEEEQQ